MCSTEPITEDSLASRHSAAGVQCPVCDQPSRLGYMQFLDPHGVMRVDQKLFECESGRHTFTALPGAVKLLSADGRLSREKTEFKPGG
ncbi:MAG: hypothetical protein K1X53_10305 [Candidatus Sumerlaeaceae bacterium]|nr:hypothetical protein [Candidatus Sumerlaeaceae bacterium]